MVEPVPCVTAILVNHKGEILLQQRDDIPTIRFAGWWSTLGGRVEEAESPDQAIRRELYEEIERLPALRRWKTYLRPGPAPIEVQQHVYLGLLDEPVATIPLHEGQALRFIDVSALADLPIAFGFAPLCEEWFRLYARFGTVEVCIATLAESSGDVPL